MATHYEIHAEAPSGERFGEIVFRTNSRELHSLVLNYIDTCVDAVSWRNRVEPRKIIEEEEA